MIYHDFWVLQNFEDLPVFMSTIFQLNRPRLEYGKQACFTGEMNPRYRNDAVVGHSSIGIFAKTQTGTSGSKGLRARLKRHDDASEDND
jgi:hypothetical protein